MEKESHSPEMSFCRMKALCELPWWPATSHVFVQRGGESWSWALCLPARILGSRVGVARQAHHFTLRCFVLWSKRETLRWAGSVTVVTFHPSRGGPQEAAPGVSERSCINPQQSFCRSAFKILLQNTSCIFIFTGNHMCLVWNLS